MLFHRQDSSFVPSVDRIFFVLFPLGRGGGGALIYYVLASRGALIRRGRLFEGGAYSSIYGNHIQHRPRTSLARLIGTPNGLPREHHAYVHKIYILMFTYIVTVLLLE